MSIGHLKEMRNPIHTFVPMVMYAYVLTCEDQGIQKDITMMNMKCKNRRIVVMSSAGFHNKSGAMEMLVSSEG